MADEPTGSLDTRTADAVFDLFEQFVAQGKTMLAVIVLGAIASYVPARGATQLTVRDVLAHE